MKRITLVATIALTGAFGLVGCAGNGGMKEEGAASTDKAAYETTLAEAKAEEKKAKAADGLWRDVGKILKHAEKDAAAGDYDKALKGAKKALFQAKMGQEQAASQVGVGNPAYFN